MAGVCRMGNEPDGCEGRRKPGLPSVVPYEGERGDMAVAPLPCVAAPGLNAPTDEGERGELTAGTCGVCVGRPMPMPTPAPVPLVALFETAASVAVVFPTAGPPPT